MRRSMMALALGCAISLPIHAAPRADLKLLLPLDENKGNQAADLSGNGHVAKFVGTPKWTTGKIGSALEFDGQSYLEVADKADSGFDGVAGLTIELWAKQDAHHDNGLVVKLTTNAFWPCSYNLETWSDTNIWFGVDQDGMAISAGGYPLNQWYHLAAVFDGKAKTQQLYLNGKKVVEGAAPKDTVPAGDKPIFIGTVDANNYRFKGAIDEVAIYARALTAAEIGQDMSGIVLAVEPRDRLAIRWAALRQAP
ncbi:LamG domain-containing protein [Candidatus Poribacteria bacterium]|nr:LamG domain-containing protein [Candidatus Poribacteria bacterium]